MKFTKNMIKKIIVGVMAFTITLFGISFGKTMLKDVMAETEGDWSYEYDYEFDEATGAEKKVAVITGYNGYETELVIPAEIGGVVVKGIGDGAFFKCYFPENISIPNGVTEIGNSAFDGCASLESIEIPGSVTKIGRNAFMRCF